VEFVSSLSMNAGGRARQRARFTVRLPVGEVRAVQRLAAEWGISPSAAASRLVQEALRADVEHQHSALIEAAVERVVRQALERVGDLAFRAALDRDETRRLVVALLFSVLGSEPAKALRREAHSAAWQRLREPAPTPPEADGVCQDSRTPS
jgi:AcrR family transcriptional regulator